MKYKIAVALSAAVLLSSNALTSVYAQPIFTTLHSFTATSGSEGADGAGTNNDGIWPFGGLILSGNTLYGTADSGGGSGDGTVFAVNTDGSGFTTLHSFVGSDGYLPQDPLILSGNTLYGTTPQGYGPGYGTVFAVNTDGSGFTNLYSFTNGSDGATPLGGLILSGDTLYGTAVMGGTNGTGTVFSLNTNGSNFTTVYTFPSGNDTIWPIGGVVLSGNTLYGTTEGGCTVFAVNTDGSGFTNLYNFGSYSQFGLILSGNTLYGTRVGGGSSGDGMVFAVNTNGSGLPCLYSFTGGSDGADPETGLILSGNTLYGTASFGGSSGNGTVFSLSFAPQLTIMLSETNVILTWPTNVAGFDYTGYTLESTTNLVSLAVWTTVSPAPVVVNGQNTVTNPISGSQQFYRLSNFNSATTVADLTY
jgi:uncharacterized repeat protein (TIGR03803 family)